ncbi:DUF1853 family protein [Saccharophagus degradans]|uniref:DUF1853 family protein n=1 Tax=Saccharophagus degradans TaxID=86304 RepID=UPI001C08800D|nr:DUF1853 family protein [Saccharophagus degradans]MBU2984149.1 DUF1853 family protein [Saccharophagus degradans]
MPNFDSFTYHTAPWENFKHRLVRDIAWLLASPALLSVASHNQIAPTLAPFNQPLCNAALNWLTELEHNPSLFGDLNRSNFRRLGLYAEALFAFICSKPTPFHSFTLLAKNLQIEKLGKTYGELDFLLRSNSNQIHHLEMAVKFYLYHPQTPLPDSQTNPFYRGANRLIGPNRKDRLDLKLKRMQEHQLPIVRTPEAKQAFLNANLSVNTLSSHLLINGRIFLPSHKSEMHTNSQLQHTPLASFVNDNISTGIWLPLSEFEQYAQTTQTKSCDIRWIVLRKLDWLAGPAADEQLLAYAMSYEDIQTRINIGGDLDFTLPILLQAINCERTPEGPNITKQEQVMLVDDRWPNHL